MHEYHICVPVELVGTRGARTLQNIADNHGSQVVRCAAKARHSAFRQSRVEALADRVARTLDECAVAVKAAAGNETREFGFTYRAIGIAAPSSLEAFEARPSEQEQDALPFEMILLDIARDMISRGYLTRNGCLRASVLVVHADGWSSAFCLDGNLDGVKMTEVSTIRSE